MNTNLESPRAPAERCYLLLLRLYPARFRREFCQPLLQLFRDQWCDAQSSRSRWTALQFWSHILSDTAFAATREHLNEFKRNLRMSSPSAWLLFLFPTPRRAFAAALALGIMLTGVLLATLPNAYVSVARVSNDSNAKHSLETELEMLTSVRLLGEVSTNLALPRRWADRYGLAADLRPEETIPILRRMVRIDVGRGTTLLSIRVQAEDQREAAEIANELAATYARVKRVQSPAAHIDIVDPAEPGLRPVRPNRPLGIAVGLLASAFTALACAGVQTTLRRRVQAGHPSSKTT